MGAGFVRFGGISALLIIAVYVLMLVLAVANPALVQNKMAGAIFLLVISALFIVMYLATKALWNNFGRNGANVPIIFLILMTVVFVALNLLGGSVLGSIGRNAGGILLIVLVVLLALNFVAWLWFAIYCIPAGSSAGGVWKAAGILYLIGTMIGIVAAIAGASALVKVIEAEMASPGSAERVLQSGTAAFGVVAFLVFGLAGLVLLAGYVCHIIGLLTGAAKMDRAY